ncbi:hypothetical protein [Chamaesiphon polymorphus]|uniref:Uncharacterized protein n=1 Tax=Chamaesiphon polymorphus CCALA 037 TaxID=2107692 RepID=A0A2T1GKN8_9CYAN|nr:hypothetical protein [Chamaesiphon polymorphus]PSB58408.1 hypothetical protein C7B77_04835 [Chamaesiphon polymorphus CCALA 037]
MPAILTVSDLAFSAWIDAIYLAVRSINPPIQITATPPTKLVLIETNPAEISRFPKMLASGSAIDK